MNIPVGSRPLRPLWRLLPWWVVAFPLVMLIALAQRDLYLLNWIHVFSGALWTGADIFMGFMLGPLLRMLDMETRTRVIAYLVPRSLLYFPVVAVTAGASGWFLAAWMGFPDQANPYYGLAMATVALLALMMVIGFGFVLPNNLRIWIELRRPAPDRDRIYRMNRANIWLAATQSVMQIAMIIMMARFRFPF